MQSRRTRAAASGGLLLSLSLTSPALAENENGDSLQLSTTPAVAGSGFSATLAAPAPGAPALLVFAPVEGFFAFANPALPTLEVGLPYAVAGAGTLGAEGTLELSSTLPGGATYEFHLQGFARSAGGTWYQSSGRRVVVGGAPTTFGDESSSLPPETAVFGQGTSDVDRVDLDRDGHLDLVLARQGAGAHTLLLLGDGAGGFSEEASLRLPGTALLETSQVAPADFDRDGLVDLVLCAASDAAATRPNLLLLGRPDGTFSESPGLAGGAGVPVCALAFDADGDGDPDLALANNPDPAHPGEQPDGVVLYVNQGAAQGGTAGTFVEDTVFDSLPGTDPHTASGDLLAGDFDADGDLDLYVARADSALGGVQNQLFLNDGGGAFAEVTAQSLPAEPDNSYEATAADFDADGDLDLFVANSLSSDPVAIHLAENVGNLGPAGEPVFVDASAKLPAEFGPVTDIRLAADHGDVDGDGDVDLVVGVHQLFDAMGALDGRTVLLLNQGGLQAGSVGTFAVGSGLTTGSFLCGDVVLGDFDGDNDLDLYVGSTGDLFGTVFADEFHGNQL